MTKFVGIGTALVTPFNAQNEVDVIALKKISKPQYQFRY